MNEIDLSDMPEDLKAMFPFDGAARDFIVRHYISELRKVVEADILSGGENEVTTP